MEWFAFTFHEIHYPRYLGVLPGLSFFVTYCPLIKENLDQSYYCMVKHNGLMYGLMYIDVRIHDILTREGRSMDRAPWRSTGPWVASLRY